MASPSGTGHDTAPPEYVLTLNGGIVGVYDTPEQAEERKRWYVKTYGPPSGTFKIEERIPADPVVSPADTPERVQLTTHKVVIDCNDAEHAEWIAEALRNDGYRVHTEVHRMVERGGKVTIERSRS